MMQVRKKTLDKATESAISRAYAEGVPLVFDRYEDMVPVCRFGQMGLDCKACTQGPCRVNPFDPSNGTTCGRDRENVVASSFLRLIADGAVVNASFAGAQSAAAGVIFDGIAAANEGMVGPAQLLGKAVEVAEAGFQALAGIKPNNFAVREIDVGMGAMKPDKINILMLGNIPAIQAEKIARELGSSSKVNLIGATGGEVAGVALAGNYNSEEALLTTTGIDSVVAGKACVSPGFLALAANQGVPVVDADRFNAAELLDGADTHYRKNAGRSLAASFSPAKAIVGFSAVTFSAITDGQWGKLADSGVRGVALIGGCNNVIATQDAAIVRLAGEFLANDALVVASGCAAAALAKAGYMDPVRTGSFAGKRLDSFLTKLSEATGLAMPAVLEARTCWEIPGALELAKLFQQKLQVPIAAAMPEVSRPASWSSALAIAARGVPTYVGPVLPLDGGLETVKTLNDILKARGGALVGPGQVGDPEAFVNKVLSAEF